jgi:hypothetical protein
MVRHDHAARGRDRGLFAVEDRCRTITPHVSSLSQMGTDVRRWLISIG